MRIIREGLTSLLRILPSNARRFLTIYAIATAMLALLDVAALAILAALISSMLVLATDGGTTMSLPVIGQINSDLLLPMLGVLVGIIVIKSAANIMLQWRATRVFARYELQIGSQLFDAYIRAPWIDRLSRTTAELVRLADVGIANTIAGFLTPVMTIPALAATFTAMLLVLVVAQPVIAAITLVYLGLIALFLYFWVSRRSVQAGRVNRDYSMRVARLMTEMVGSLKEVTLRDKFDEVATVVRQNRIRTTTARANLSFLGAVPRYVIDSALMGGIVLIGGVSYWLDGLTGMISAVALFGVAGFRLVPSLTSFQSVITQTSASAPHLRAVLRDIEAAKDYVRNAETVGHEPLPESVKEIRIEDVSFTYPTGREPAVADVSVTIPVGSSVAFVGASGSGKSTLVDLLLGLLTPQHGLIAIDDQPLTDVLAAWRRRVGYVPQDVSLFDATVAQNVALTWSEDYDEDRVIRALQQAQLYESIEQRPGGIHARIGERGLALSGGQRQRLGIARALYTDPLVLVLDEATSALDTETESRVITELQSLAGDITLVSVAHRLSTIRHCDQILFMSAGKVAAQGSFEELARSVPEFEIQARLAGLIT